MEQAVAGSYLCSDRYSDANPANFPSFLHRMHVSPNEPHMLVSLDWTLKVPTPAFSYNLSRTNAFMMMNIL